MYDFTKHLGKKVEYLHNRGKRSAEVKTNAKKMFIELMIVINRSLVSCCLYTN